MRAEAVGPSAHSPAAVLMPAEVEFDGGATDVADVAVADFPVLLDAVEAAAPAPAVKPAVAAPPSAAAPAAPPSAAAARALHRAEPPSRPAPKPTAPPAAPAAASMAPSRVGAAKPTAREDSNADDVLRQTQTMRAIASAKSIDDISDVDAETLFGDAELDLVSAALASAAEWPDEDELAPPPARSERAKAAPAPRPEPPKAAAAPARPDQAKTGTVRPEAAAAPPADDPFDLFGLGEDAPLELIDDATLPPANPPRRSAVR
jgi:hypothetical protein